MDTATLRDTLEDAGLSQYQSEAYITLLRMGSASATEIADGCSVPPARIYDVIRDLERKGYVETYEQDSLHARAVEPGTVLSELRSRADLLSSAAEEIETRWEAPAVDRHKISIVKRFRTVFDRAAEAIANAEDEVQLSVSESNLEELHEVLSDAVDRGVIVKISLNADTRDDPAPPSADRFEGVATEVRYRPLPTPFIALVDRTNACFAPTRGSLNEYGVLIHDRSLTYIFHWYFLTCLWEAWDELYSVRSAEPPIIYTDIRRCLRDIEPLFAAGEKVLLTVEGYDTTTGDRVTRKGQVTDLAYAGASNHGEPVPLAQLAGQGTIYISDEDGKTTSVGGWGAVLEDIEATRLTVTEVVAADERKDT